MTMHLNISSLLGNLSLDPVLRPQLANKGSTDGASREKQTMPLFVFQLFDHLLRQNAEFASMASVEAVERNIVGPLGDCFPAVEDSTEVFWGTRLESGEQLAYRIKEDQILVRGCRGGQKESGSMAPSFPVLEFQGLVDEFVFTFSRLSPAEGRDDPFDVFGESRGVCEVLRVGMTSTPGVLQAGQYCRHRILEQIFTGPVTQTESGESAIAELSELQLGAVAHLVYQADKPCCVQISHAFRLARFSCRVLSKADHE
jgi:hypothetical protein